MIAVVCGAIVGLGLTLLVAGFHPPTLAERDPPNRQRSSRQVVPAGTG